MPTTAETNGLEARNAAQENLRYQINSTLRRQRNRFGLLFRQLHSSDPALFQNLSPQQQATFGRLKNGATLTNADYEMLTAELVDHGTLFGNRLDRYRFQRNGQQTNLAAMIQQETNGVSLDEARAAPGQIEAAVTRHTGGWLPGGASWDQAWRGLTQYAQTHGWLAAIGQAISLIFGAIFGGNTRSNPLYHCIARCVADDIAGDLPPAVAGRVHNTLLHRAGVPRATAPPANPPLSGIAAAELTGAERREITATIGAALQGSSQAMVVLSMVAARSGLTTAQAGKLKDRIIAVLGDTAVRPNMTESALVTELQTAITEDTAIGLASLTDAQRNEIARFLPRIARAARDGNPAAAQNPEHIRTEIRTQLAGNPRLSALVNSDTVSQVMSGALTAVMNNPAHANRLLSANELVAALTPALQGQITAAGGVPALLQPRPPGTGTGQQASDFSAFLANYMVRGENARETLAAVQPVFNVMVAQMVQQRAGDLPPMVNRDRLTAMLRTHLGPLIRDHGLGALGDYTRVRAALNTADIDSLLTDIPQGFSLNNIRNPARNLIAHMIADPTGPETGAAQTALENQMAADARTHIHAQVLNGLNRAQPTLNALSLQNRLETVDPNIIAAAVTPALTAFVRNNPRPLTNPRQTLANVRNELLAAFDRDLRTHTLQPAVRTRLAESIAHDFVSGRPRAAGVAALPPLPATDVAQEIEASVRERANALYNLMPPRLQIVANKDVFIEVASGTINTTINQPGWATMRPADRESSLRAALNTALTQNYEYIVRNGIHTPGFTISNPFTSMPLWNVAPVDINCTPPDWQNFIINNGTGLIINGIMSAAPRADPPPAVAFQFTNHDGGPFNPGGIPVGPGMRQLT